MKTALQKGYWNVRIRKLVEEPDVFLIMAFDKAEHGECCHAAVLLMTDRC